MQKLTWTVEESELFAHNMKLNGLECKRMTADNMIFESEVTKIELASSGLTAKELFTNAESGQEKWEYAFENTTVESVADALSKLYVLAVLNDVEYEMPEIK